MASTLSSLEGIQIGIFFIIITLIFIYILLKPELISPPGPWGLPIFGTSLFIREAQYKVFSRWSSKYGPILKTRIGMTDIIILDDSNVMREALNDVAFSGRGNNKVLNIISGGKYGITSNEGPNWAEQRRFVLKHLRDFGFGKQSMEEVIMAEVGDFLRWAKQSAGTPTPVNKRLTLATLNTLWAIVTGHRKAQDDATLSKIIDTADEALQNLARTSHLVLFPKLIDILPNFLLGPWHKAKQGMEALTAEFTKAIEDHKEHPTDDARDLIDVYLKAIQCETEENSSFYKDHGEKSLLAVVGDMFAAGAGASSETINWAILYLAKYLHVQKKFQSEIDSVIGRNRVPTLADRSGMPYTEALINEVLRFSSVAPTIFHYTTKNTKLRGFDIRKGSTVISNVYSIHHSKRNWGDPETFRPERFLSEDGKTQIKSEHLIPFGIGKRQCIGESLARINFFLFLTSIFQQYEILLDPNFQNITMEPKPGFILEAQDFKVIFTPRYSTK